MRRLNKVVFLVLSVSLCLIVGMLSLSYYFYHNKVVHVSIDDVWDCFNDISTDSTLYANLFEHPFFSQLKKAHSITGAKFTLYVFESVDRYNIDDIPHKFIIQLEKEKEWLRVGFHASNDTIGRVAIGELVPFQKSYDHVNEVFGTVKTIRLHHFYATPDEVSYLKDNGVKTLLSADDDRINYSLPSSCNDSLFFHESLYYNGMHYEHTDYRIEDTLSPFMPLFRNKDDDVLVLFTHEWALQNKWTWYKLWFYLAFFSICNSIFIID